MRARRRPVPGIVAASLIAMLAAAPATALDRAVRIVPHEDRELAPPPELPKAPILKNNVGLKLDIMPGPTIPVGSTLSFRVSAKKAGYVLIVDIDAAGKLTQIYPNVLSLAKTDGAPVESNRIAADAAVSIPREGSKVYEFVASPPQGIGMVIAVFSETPLDVIDLPDVPARLVGTPDAAGFVRDAAGTLRMVPADGSGGFQEPNLSFDAGFYAIR